MSQEGLLRTILHDALLQRPDLIHRVLPVQWNRLQTFGTDLHPWILTELMAAFDRLVACTTENSFKLCLFVDGMDEFDGDHELLIKLFKHAIT